MKLLKQQVKFLKKVPKQELKEVTQNFEFIYFVFYPSFDVFFYVFVQESIKLVITIKKHKENFARKEKYLKKLKQEKQFHKKMQKHLRMLIALNELKKLKTKIILSNQFLVKGNYI